MRFLTSLIGLLFIISIIANFFSNYPFLPWVMGATFIAYFLFKMRKGMAENKSSDEE